MFNLNGKKGLVVGIANNKSIAYGCAKAFNICGAELAVTYLNEKAEPHVRPLAELLAAPLVLPLDVEQDDQLAAVFAAIEQKWGKLDFLLHSIAFAPKEDLHGRVVDCSRQGFLRAIDISCHSFIRMAHLAEPLMPQGGSLVTMSYLGAQETIEGYALMGPVKAALESSVRYLATELGPHNIRVHAISPGPMPTRAASGLKDFDHLLQTSTHRAPLRRLVSLEEVGGLCAWLVSNASQGQTGGVHFVDGGLNILG